MSNGITISGNTTLAQLDQVLKGVDQGKELRARTNSQGDTVLYTTTTLSSILDRVLMRTESRQAQARDTIQAVFDRFQQSHPKAGGDGQAASTKLFSHVRTELDYKARHGGITAADVRSLTAAADGIMRTIPDTGPASGPRGPTLAEAGISPKDETIKQAAAALVKSSNDEDRLDSAAQHLAAKVAKGFLDGSPSADRRDAFALTTGSELKGELKEAIKSAARAAGANTMNAQALATLVDKVYDQAASKVLPDHAVEGKFSVFPNRTMPHIVINGREYQPTKELGEGSFGTVYQYESADKPTHQIALKLPKANQADPHNAKQIRQKERDIREFAGEVEAHRQACRTPNGNVLALEGVLRLPDGRIGIAMELASLGDADHVNGSIGKAIDTGQQPASGKITADEAKILRLTMLKDMVAGLNHLHAREQVTHYDFKAANCFVGGDGSVKVADFGLGFKGGDTATMDEVGNRKAQNPFFKAPERMRADDESAVIADRYKQQKELSAHLAQLLPMASPETQAVLAKNILSEIASDEKHALFVDRKVDVWGLGASALEFFTGQKPMEHLGFWSSAEDAINQFGQTRTNAPLSDPDASGHPQGGSIGVKTGTAEIDDLLSAMLAPVADDRDSAAELLRRPAFGIDGVGSPEAKALIAALMGNDNTAIDNARQALAGVM